MHNLVKRRLRRSSGTDDDSCSPQSCSATGIRVTCASMVERRRMHAKALANIHFDEAG